MRLEMPIVSVGDETEMLLFVARPTRLPAPGILFLPEVFGIDTHTREVAGRLAHMGYTVVVPEIFHRTATRGWEGHYEDVEEATAHYQALTEKGIEADLRAAYDWLRKDHSTQAAKIAALGFSSGGRFAFLANAMFPLKATATFYGDRIFPNLLAMSQAQQGALLMFWGGKDEHIGPKAPAMISESLTKARKVHNTVEFSEAGHGFFCDARDGFHPYAAHQAWAHLLSFLECHLK